jgi:hypothetical protein
MDKNKIILSSLSLDLKRIAIAYHRGSDKMAERFIKEVDRWLKSVNTSELPAYINVLLKNLNKILRFKEKERIAEDCLMYSTLFQNYSVYDK